VSKALPPNFECGTPASSPTSGFRRILRNERQSASTHYIPQSCAHISIIFPDAHHFCPPYITGDLTNISPPPPPFTPYLCLLLLLQASDKPLLSPVVPVTKVGPNSHRPLLICSTAAPPVPPTLPPSSAMMT